MHVKLIGPDQDHETEHKIDAGAAAMLAVQLSKRHTYVREGSVEVETPPIEVTIDDEKLLVAEARIQFWTAGDTMDAELTLKLVKP